MKIFFNDNFCTIYKLQLNHIAEYLIQNGLQVVTEQYEADVIVIGLCAAFEADETRSMKIINDALKLNLTCGGDKKSILAFGCFTKIREDIISRFNNIKSFYFWEISKILSELGVEKKEAFDCYNTIWPSEFRLKEDYRVYDETKKFIGISTGCSFNCVYCPHKLGSGDLRSRSPHSIIDQIKHVTSGEKNKVTRIILTGTDTAAYGNDINIRFTDLLENILLELDRIPLNLKIRIAQFNPEGLKNNFNKMVELCRDNRIEDFQLPLQTSSSRLLRIMKRYYVADNIKRFIKKVKEYNKKIIFRTDLLIGFPTETIKELIETTKFASKYFDEIAVYKFEFKKGTEIEFHNFEYFSEKEKEIRKNIVYDILSRSSCLVHSGGQDIESLLNNDVIKERKYTYGKQG